jgi:maleylacetoacetate isomerase
MIQLYTYFRSSAAFRVRIALNLKGVRYAPHFINLPKGEHGGEAYKQVNAQGLVPALVDDDGNVLAQSLAIMEYLDETQPGPKLLPESALDRAYARAFAQIIACEIHPLNNLRTLRHVKRAYNQDDEGINRWYRHWIAEGFAIMEAFLDRNRRHGKHVLGDQPTIADCCLVPQVFNAKRYECELTPYPRVMRIHDECMKLAAFIDAQPAKQPDATA